MTGFCWLASYPKSGNTWFRLVAANLAAESGQPVDINNIPESGGIASGRGAFDTTLLVESGLLTHDEADTMRPMLYRGWAEPEDGTFENAMSLASDYVDPERQTRLVKTHDAWTVLPDGTPLMGGATASARAIIIVRDPRDVAASLANHLGVDIDEAIAFMADGNSTFAGGVKGQSSQLRQRLLRWGDFYRSWLDQDDILVHLVRYEDMQADPVAAIGEALAFAGRTTSLDALARAVDNASFERLRTQEDDGVFREAPPGRRFFRQGRSGGWRDELTADQVASIEASQIDMMDRLGYIRIAQDAPPEHKE